MEMLGPDAPLTVECGLHMNGTDVMHTIHAGTLK